MIATVDLLDQVRALLAGASTSDPDVRIVYLAKARALFTSATEELRGLELLLVARERELVAVGQPKTQEELPAKAVRS